ncbi:MAG: hypothetical protein PHU85_20300 [Phycisphaerae bacterium]|nr:hypothetical protein [Phycisphaerae bacterium]
MSVVTTTVTSHWSACVLGPMLVGSLLALLIAIAFRTRGRVRIASIALAVLVLSIPIYFPCDQCIEQWGYWTCCLGNWLCCLPD